MEGRDDGVTLIELVISITLLTVIMAAIVGAMLIVFNTLDTTRQRVTDSSGAQLVTSWLVSDAQSADHVQPSAGCGGSPVLELQWSDADPSVTTGTDVEYVLQSAGGTEQELTRNVYSVSSGGACTLTDSAVLVRNASSVTAACAPACTDSATQVGLAITAQSQTLTAHGATGYSSYSFTAIGARRTA